MHIRRFKQEEAEAVNALLQAAYAELALEVPEWSLFQFGLGLLVGQAAQNEVYVAEVNERLAGAVGYVGPGQPKREFFRPEWPIVRPLSVAPEF